MKKPALLSRPVRLAGCYVLFSALWILFSDQALRLLDLDPTHLALAQSYKGIAFVLASSLLIYVLARHDQRTRQLLENSLHQGVLNLQHTQREAGLASWRYDGRFHWSEEAMSLFGRDVQANSSSLEELLEWLYPTDRNALQRAFEHLFTSGGPLQVNARTGQNDGEAPTWLMFKGEQRTDGHIQGTLQNISTQKRDEMALRENEQRLRQIIEQTPGIAVQGYDRDRRVIFWNHASAQLYGYNVTEALGQRLEELVTPPSCRAQTINDITHWMAGGPAVPPGEITLQRRDGEPIRVYSSQLLLRNGRNQWELFRIDMDLSHQQRRNQELEASERRYRELVEQLHECIFLTDEAGRLSFLNGAWETLTGKSIQESLGRSLLEFIDDAYRQPLGEQIRQVLIHQSGGWQGDSRLREANGQRRWISLSLAVGGQHETGLRGSFSDIHERRQGQALQEARNAMLDQLLAHQPLQRTLEDMILRMERLNPDMLISVMLLENGQLRLGAAPSLSNSYCAAVDGVPATAGNGSCGHAAATGELTIAKDLLNHPHWAPYRDLVTKAGLRACWSLPFKNDHGEVMGTFGVYYRQVTLPTQGDIDLVTEFTRLAGLAVSQHQLNAERLQSDLRFRATFEQAAVGIAHLSIGGIWLRVNQRLCRMLGYNRDELLELSLQSITHPGDMEADREQLQSLLAGEASSYSMERRYLKRNGKLLWANLSVTLVRHGNGEPSYFISVIEDISLRKQQEQALRQAATVFESTREAVAIVDSRRRILTSNPAFSTFVGQPAEQTLGKRIPLAAGDPQERIQYRDVWRAVDESGHWEGELAGTRQDGSQFPYWMTVSQVRDGDPEQPQYVLTFTDLSQYRDSQERLAHLVHFDPLTDLPNRLFANERLRHAVEHAHRHHEQVAVMVFDLDHFKTINEGLGHKAGDELLIAVARRLQKRLRNEDTLARLSSDEFLVILEDLPSQEEVASIATSLLQLLERPLALSNGREAYLGASIGISQYPDDGNTCEELLRSADAALHQAKQQGRNTYRFYTKGLTSQAQSRLTLESQMRQALRRNEFILHYQPLVDAASGEAFGVEALVRWNSEQGLISPATFIPLAEETGLIVPLGAWVMREACRQMQFWRQQGLPLHTLAVNLSPRQFRLADLLKQVRDALTDSGLPAECLELEITEGALMENVEQSRSALVALKGLGIKIAIDDFGTGYSSLAYLRRFPLDKLKIDQSFMQGVPKDQANLEIVATIIGLARNLNLQVLAEGVETEDQLQALRDLGCEHCQGYLFSKPLSAIQLVNWLRDDQQSVG